MDTYKIVPKRTKYMRWFVYSGIILAALYLYLAYDAYHDEGWGFELIINLICGVIWLAFPFFQFRHLHPYDYDQIELSDKGITFGKSDELQTSKWSAIDHIKMTNKSLFFNLKNQTQQEFNITFMEYKQLQTTKKNIRKFSDSNNIDFFSIYLMKASDIPFSKCLIEFILTTKTPSLRRRCTPEY